MRADIVAVNAVVHILSCESRVNILQSILQAESIHAEIDCNTSNIEEILKIALIQTPSIAPTQVLSMLITRPYQAPALTACLLTKTTLNRKSEKTCLFDPISLWLNLYRSIDA